MALSPSLSGLVELLAERAIDWSESVWRRWRSRDWVQLETQANSPLGVAIMAFSRSCVAPETALWVTPDVLSRAGSSVAALVPVSSVPVDDAPAPLHAGVVPDPRGLKFEWRGAECSLEVEPPVEEWGTYTLRLYIRCKGQKGPELMRVLNEVSAMAQSQEAVGLLVRQWRPAGQYWDNIRLHAHRPMSSLFLDGEPSTLFEDVATFLASEARYVAHGQMYKRVYLLHGPPGGGKTSCVMGLASALRYSVCIIPKSISNEGFMRAFAALPARSILLIEEADGLPGIGSGPDDDEDALTEETVLQVFDGMLSRHGALVFLTTNHRDRLSDRLLRSRRIDRQYLFDVASQRQVDDIAARYGVDPEAAGMVVGAPVSDVVERAWAAMAEKGKE